MSVLLSVLILKLYEFDMASFCINGFPLSSNFQVWYPVTPAMGKPSFDGPECIKEVWQFNFPLILLRCPTLSLTSKTGSYHISHVLQIQLKAEGNTSISKFFTRKVAEGEDTKPEDKIQCQEFVKTEDTKDLREEVKKEEGDEDIKSGDTPSSQNVTKFPIKREYDVISADSNPALSNTKVNANPVKKKEKTKTANDKQPTLFSYFGKK